MGVVSRPNFVVIGPHRYDIHWDQAAVDRERVKQESVNMGGTIKYAELLIAVDPDNKPSQARRVLLHEIIHGICDVTGWRNVPPEKPDADDFIVRVDAMLLDTMQRNPHVVAWLMETT